LEKELIKQKKLFSIKTLDNVLKISELNITYLFESSILYQAFPHETVSYPALLFENTKFAFVT